MPGACLAHPENRHNHIAMHKSPLILGVAFLFQQALNFSPANGIYTGKPADIYRG
jgi:hypothetical protein